MIAKSSKRQSGAPTINDVARHAGVSPMTVSRVINGESKVRPATRAVVESAIAALNYAPNAAARSLAGAEEIRLGLLYSNPSAAFLSEILVGGLDQAARANVQLLVENCGTAARELDAVEHMVRIGIDGVLLPSPLCESAGIIETLRRAEVPAVAVASGRPSLQISAVDIDDHRAAFEMTAHLARLGHRRIGFIVGSPKQNASGRRLDGYRAALAASGLPYEAGLVAPGLFTYRSGMDAADRLLSRDEPPTAIFASNDDMAAATVAVAHRRGLDVPADLAVCGFDDTALATTIWPELTTIRQPIAEMSRAAVELLLREVRARRAGQTAPPSHLTLDFTLVRRQSDSAPRGPGASRRLRAAES